MKFKILEHYLVEGPPSGDDIVVAGGYSNSQPLLKSAKTVAPLTAQNLVFPGDSMDVAQTKNMMLVSQNGYYLDNTDGWKSGSPSGAVPKVTADISIPARVSNVSLGLCYSEGGGGSDTGTTVVISDEDGQQSVSYRVNTEQSQPGWAMAPKEFSFERGVHTLELDVYIAKNNYLTLKNFGINVPGYTPMPLSVSFFWKCVRVRSLTPNGTYSLGRSYESGVTNTSTSTSIVSQSLGLSVSAGYSSISAALDMSLEKETHHSNTVELFEETSTEDHQEFKNPSKKTVLLQLWQPCIRYGIGLSHLVMEKPGTLIATSYPSVDEKLQDLPELVNL